MTNHYEPPRANVERRNDEPGSLPKAVAIGVLIDIAGTLVVGFGAAIVYGVVLGMRGYSEEAIASAFESLEPWSPFGIFASLLGLAVSAFAGYHCARIANRDGYLAPGILAIISCAFGAALSGDSYARTDLLIFSALTVLAVLSGASRFVTRRHTNV